MQSSIARFHVENYAGYRCLEWEGIDSEVNLLVGQNGVGKSLLLEGLIITLNYVAGQHSRDLISRSNLESVFELQFTGDPHIHRFSSEDVRSIQGGRDTGWTCQILHVVENRQPKNIVGREGPPHRQNPIMRYQDASARLKVLATSEFADKRAMADEVFDLCRRLPAVALPIEWDWIRNELSRRGPTMSRPSSCGQFDVLAILLDLVSFRHDVMSQPAPHYVIWDNPETYLHPACLRPLLDLMREQLRDAQFFIATHSTKLLTYARPKSVFWLPREAREYGDVRLTSIRTLQRGAQTAFFELYGEDVDPGLFSLLGELESPEAHRFLAECALECYARPRLDVGRDPQNRLVIKEIPQIPVTILDYGAGHGNLLGALADVDYLHPDLLYVGLDPEPPRLLRARVAEFADRGRIHGESRVITHLEEAPPQCDIVALLNVAHHLKIPDLARLLHDLLTNRLRRNSEARLIVSELRTLAKGERNFILWTPEDFMDLLASVEGVEVLHRTHEGRHQFEAIDATIIRWRKNSDGTIPSSDELERRFWHRLPVKRETCLDELADLRSREAADGLERRWHQHRVAFLCAQIAWLCAAERERLPGSTPRTHP